MPVSNLLFTISLSFQNIGGLNSEIVVSKFFVFSNSLLSLTNLLAFINNVLIIKIQSSQSNCFHLI